MGERFTFEGFQKNMVIRFVLITASGGFISTILFYLITKRRLDDILYTFHLPQSIEHFLLPDVVMTNLAGLLIIMIALVLTMRSVFWKVAGPLFRISQDIQKLIDGDLTVNIRLRKDDEFKDMAEDFDHMGKSMRDKFRKIKENFTELSVTVEDMALYHDDKETIKAKTAELKKNIEGLREGLNAFKI